MPTDEQYQDVINALKDAPYYQPVILEPNDPPFFRRFIEARNAMCKRIDDRKVILDHLQGFVLDFGCNLGWFAFAAKSFKRYVGIDSDAKAIDACQALWKIRCKSSDRVMFLAHDMTDWLSNMHGHLSTRTPRIDVCLYLSLHHHIIGAHGMEKAKQVLRQISDIAETMIFDMGQKDEPNNPSRAVWHDALPDEDPYEFIVHHVLNNSRYGTAEQIGESHVSEAKTGRLLFRFC